MLWGGSAVFRELVQRPDGTLGVRVPPELIPACGAPADLTGLALTPGCVVERGAVRIDAQATQEVVALGGLPGACRIQCRVTPAPGSARFGLGLRGSGRYVASYDLAFYGHTGVIALEHERCDRIGGLGQPFTLDIVLTGDIIDVCVDGQQCLINRLPERAGDQLFLFCEQGAVAFEELTICPLL